MSLCRPRGLIVLKSTVALQGEINLAPLVHLHLLADLMPVNFLYYGVPSETMNQVMDELLGMSAHLVRGRTDHASLPAALLALDHEIRR